MYYNPHTPQIRELETHIAEIKATLDSQSEQLNWYRSFDATTAAQQVIEETATEEKYASHALETDAKIQDIKGQIIELKKASKLGWSRTNWPFATERNKSRKDRQDRIAQYERLKKNMRSYLTKKNIVRKSIDIKKELLHRYASFDITAVSIENCSLQQALEAHREELISLKNREAAVELLIKAPLEELQECEREIQYLKRQKAEAQNLDAELSRAANSYERKLVHEKSQRNFSTGSPRKVADRATRQIAAKRRDAKKLQHRIEALIQHESQDVRSLIIDGSNLCYEGNKLIGLSSLRALCEALPKEINVEVIFDGSILKKLGLLNEKALHAHLPDIAVHLVYDRAGADETILEAAADQTTYVISGDRFADYPDKAAVRESRVFKPQIINRRILVPQLGINLKYSSETL